MSFRESGLLGLKDQFTAHVPKMIHPGGEKQKNVRQPISSQPFRQLLPRGVATRGVDFHGLMEDCLKGNIGFNGRFFERKLETGNRKHKVNGILFENGS